MIIVKPTAGLCNRMRVIDSCISVQQNNPKKHSIKMIWEQNEWLNCSFEDLFEPIEHLESVSTNPYLSYFLYYRNNTTLKLKARIKKKLYSFLAGNYQYFDDRNIQSVAYKHDYWNTSKHDFVIHTCIDFYSPEIQNTACFKPVLKLQNLINQEVKKFTRPTTGIHIRRTDSTKSVNKSSTNLFLTEIETLLKEDSNQLFFLATDDANEELLFKSRFGDHIITQENKDLSRNSKKGMEDALVDLYTLSKTNLILGSYWSSFSKTAAGLSKIPLKIIA